MDSNAAACNMHVVHLYPPSTIARHVQIKPTETHAIRIKRSDTIGFNHDQYFTYSQFRTTMASNSSPGFAYTVVYVQDVAKSVDFYAKAFGNKVRRLDEAIPHRWGELESGQTTIAFTPLQQHETDDLTGEVHISTSSRERQQLEVCFVYPDVDAAYKRAVEQGAVPVSEPELKEWGQKVGYVRDIDGIVVRMGSYVNPRKHD